VRLVEPAGNSGIAWHKIAVVKLKRFARFGLLAFAVCGALTAGIYYFATKEPTPITVNPGLYDDYAGYYAFSTGYPVTIRRDGDRLIASLPEYSFKQLFPETETQFFLKGSPARWIFHRDEKGRVDFFIYRWKNGEERVEKRPTLPANPEGTNGLIVATTAGKATEAGLRVLQEGGNAVDAAITTAMCEVVQVGGSYVSFAGPMLMVYYDAASGKVFYLDAQYATPLEEKDPKSIPRTGGRTALVPGFMAGMQAAHDRFGKLPFKRLLEPAIALADKGEVVSPGMEQRINSKKGVLSRYPETKRIFTRSDGKFLATGDLFLQPELADTLRKVAARGAAYMYVGDWGRKFIEVVQREGSKLTMEDMKRYHATWEEPLQTSYREYQVFTSAGRGGVEIIQDLNLVELANLRQFGPYRSSPESLFLLVEISACRAATGDVPEATRLSKSHAAEIWQQITNCTWPGLPAKLRWNPVAFAHSDGLVVVDQWGNMAVVNHTINTILWGNTGLFVDGVSIPDSAGFQRAEIAKAGPGNRLPAGMCPLIVCRDGKPYLGSAAVGGGLHAKTIQMLVNVLDFGMDPQASADTPAFIGWGAAEVEADAFDPKVLDGLRRFGLTPKVVSSRNASLARGYWAGALIDPATQHVKGGVSRRGLEGGLSGIEHADDA
jgi:gamma-glutamyltranspeptidase/glutathione hydrolase